ncbi:putative purine permease 4 [Acorus gramineus]|uniref:Probable purine permease n=1 Tax=Acorus gramineus TaxID=55184 RepID=A0AAV9APS2_ACOGR|nr:putative purine permease 4 [Acorus gramineus]
MENKNLLPWPHQSSTLNQTQTTATINPTQDPQDPTPPTTTQWFHHPHCFILISNYLSLFIGSISSTLLTRLYFIHGGSNRWLSTMVQSAGFPLLLPLLLHLSRVQNSRPFSSFTRRHLLVSATIGLMMGINNFLISWGISYLSVSTSSLLLSTQLVFNLGLSVLLVKQKLSFTNMNSVVLITLSSVLLAVGSSKDRPPGVTRQQYWLGFLSILGSAFLFALYLPLVEMAYKRVTRYKMVVEMQVVMEAVATVFAMVGMAAAAAVDGGGGVGGVVKEGREGFDMGVVKYGLVVGMSVVTWQMCFMGTAGLVYMTTSLSGGICTTALLPMNVVGGVVSFGDAFGGVKAVSTVLCVWGFGSYLYGEYCRMRKEREREGREKEMVGVVDSGGDDGVISECV